MTATQSPARSDIFYLPPQQPGGLMGLPHLMEQAFRGVNLLPVAQALISRASDDAQDANALMDLASVMHLTGQSELGLRIQQDALSLSRHYSLPAQGPARLRVLSLMTPGAPMDNAPFEYLLQGSDITLDMLYLDPTDTDQALVLPPHDVVCIGVSESEAARPLLHGLARQVRLVGHTAALPHPVLNDPARILATARANAWQLLQDIPGCLTPPTISVSRSVLTQLSQGKVPLQALLPGACFPLICRPHGSHAGHGLVKLDGAAALSEHLLLDASAQFYLSPFVDYCSADGQYRKYRITFVGGRPYPVHMALSARWMVHYLNGDMADRPDNRAHEQHFFDAFDADFGARHAQALAAIDQRIGLDYFSLDCGELPDGRLLVFEVDAGAVVHAMDPLQDFGYKRPHMLRIFAAFRALLARAAAQPSALKPKAPLAAEPGQG
jgi:hypothetical protein